MLNSSNEHKLSVLVGTLLLLFLPTVICYITTRFHEAVTILLTGLIISICRVCITEMPHLFLARRLLTYIIIYRTNVCTPARRAVARRRRLNIRLTMSFGSHKVVANDRERQMGDRGRRITLAGARAVLSHTSKHPRGDTTMTMAAIWRLAFTTKLHVRRRRHNS